MKLILPHNLVSPCAMTIWGLKLLPDPDKQMRPITVMLAVTLFAIVTPLLPDHGVVNSGTESMNRAAKLCRDGGIGDAQIFFTPFDVETSYALEPDLFKASCWYTVAIRPSLGKRFASDLARALSAESVVLSNSRNGEDSIDCRFALVLYDRDGNPILAFYQDRFGNALVNGKPYIVNNALSDLLIAKLSALSQ